jgi:hypothetical protein
MLKDHLLVLQSNEFDRLNALIKAYNNLPAVVDDDYPRMRHYYENALKTFLQACSDNGRYLPEKTVGTITFL